MLLQSYGSSSSSSSKRHLVGYTRRLCQIFWISRPFAIQVVAGFGSHSGSSCFLTPRPIRSFTSTPTALFSSMFNPAERYPAAAAPCLKFGADNLKCGGDDEDYSATVLMGKKEQLDQLAATLLCDTLDLSADTAILTRMLGDVDAKSGGSSTTLLTTTEGSTHRMTLCGLPQHTSRNLSPSSFHAIPALVKSQVVSIKQSNCTRLLILMDNDSDASIGPYAAAISKGVSLFSLKTAASDSSAASRKKIHVSFVKADGTLLTDATQLQAAQAVADGVQLAARLVDTHPEQLTTTAFVEREVQSLMTGTLQALGVIMTEISGDDLIPYGGLHAVGRAAEHPPRMVIMEYDGRTGDKSATDTNDIVALVGKGIVYDTGGLALKSKDGMSGMKADMGGAAALLGGFVAACQMKVDKKVVLILCLAENAVGPTAFRNDDILTMYSGKTVEVNNPDAEGRLVLADGVAHATKHVQGLGLVVDMATLTGAQLVATGKTHAGVVANSKQVEDKAVVAGLKSGDYVFPMLYCPELLVDEFKSEVADMKNSVKDRGNAQSSCAGHFVESHLDEGYKGGWLHVDIAGPAWKDGRGTGYGVGLVLSLLSAPGW